MKRSESISQFQETLKMHNKRPSMSKQTLSQSYFSLVSQNQAPPEKEDLESILKSRVSVKGSA